MKNRKGNHPGKNGARSKKSFAQSRKQFRDISEGLSESREGINETSEQVPDIREKFSGIREGLAETREVFPEVSEESADIRESFSEVREMFSDIRESKKQKNLSFSAIILLAITRADGDYIPGADAEFDEWQDNFVKTLGMPWVPDGAPVPPVGAGAAVPADAPATLHAYLGITAARYGELTAEQRKWVRDFRRGGKEADRRSSETVAKQTMRAEYEHFIREFVAESIRGNRRASAEIKRALKLTVPDTHPSKHNIPISDIPYFTLTPIGGGKMRWHVRPVNDTKRASMLKGASLEVAFQIITVDEPRPGYIEDLTKNFTSTKSIFIQSCGTNNVGKFLFVASRWIDPKNPSRNGPWSGISFYVIA